MSEASAQRNVRVYIVALGAVLVAVLVPTLFMGEFRYQAWAWLVLVALFAVLELGDLLFHHEGDREGLSSSETIFLPLVIGMSFDQAVWGVVLAMTFAALADRRVDSLKGTFNVANLGCAAAAGAGIWAALADEGAGLTPRNVAVALAAVLVFSVLTHVFVSIAISLSQGKGFSLLLGSIVPTIGWNLAGNISLGLFLSAAYLHESWLVLLFPLPLGFLYFGYRAVVNQNAERQRVEKLLSASRALASSASLEEALTEFLRSVQHIASAAEARVIVDSNRGMVWSAVRGERSTAEMQPLEEDGPMRALLTAVERSQSALIVTAESGGEAASVRDALGVSGLLAIPLMDRETVVGCLVTIDRVGADDFGRSEARLLEALGHELVLTLDSYRLFAEVSEERERFRRIFTSSKEGIILLDDNGAVMMWNPAIARISGYEAVEVIGRPWSERIVLRDGNARRIEGMALVDAPPEQELELVSRDGPSRWVAVLSSPVQGVKDKAWVVLVRDVTAEHLVEVAKSDFLSTISHELRTPLTAIKGSVGMLQRDPQQMPAGVYERMVSVLQRGTSRLERLVMNLLFVSQVDAGGTPRVLMEDFDLVSVLKERSGPILGDHPTTFDLPDEPVKVRADRERLGQVIEHLVENAAKFDPDGETTVTVVKEAGFARLSVSDRGPGIPQVDQERIFERFVRLGDVLTRATQGPGVGLFVVKKSMEAMGGEVWVESTMGQGSTFHVTFQLSEPMVIEGGASAS